MDVTESQWLEGTKLFQFSFDVANINEFIACKELESERRVCQQERLLGRNRWRYCSLTSRLNFTITNRINLPVARTAQKTKMLST